MHYTAFIALIFVTLALAQTDPLVGTFTQLNGLSTDGLTTFDGTTYMTANQDLTTSFFASSTSLNDWNGKGEYFTAKQVATNWVIEYHNTTVRTRIGGRNGYFTGGNVLKILSTNSKLYVCGTFTQVGTLLVNQTQHSSRIVELDISSGVSISTTYGRVLPDFQTSSEVYGLGASCTNMWKLNEDLIIRESWTSDAPFVRYSGSAAPVQISRNNCNFTQVYITNFVNATQTMYVLGANLNDAAPGFFYFIQKYSGSGQTWTPVYPSSGVADGNAASNAIRSFVAGPSDLLYYTFKNVLAGDTTYENRDKYIYEIRAGQERKVAKNARFSSDVRTTTSFLDSTAFVLTWDPVNSRLVVGNVAGQTGGQYGVILGDESQIATQGIANIYNAATQMYGKRLNYFAHLFNDTWTPAYGGGFSTLASAVTVSYVNGRATFGGNFKTSWNEWAANVAVWNPTMKKYVAFFAPGKGLDADPLAGGNTAGVSAFNEDFNLNDGGILAGYFRTLDNVTVNSIVMVDKNGVPTPLSQTNGSFADVGVRSLSTSPTGFEYAPGVVNAIAHLPTSKYTYVAGSFQIAGTVGVSNIARYNWNSKTWHDVAGGVSGQVNALLRDGEKLYVAGNFKRAGNLTVNNVALFNTATQQWSALNFGLDGTVNKLMWYKGNVLALGSFTTGSGANQKGNLLPQLAEWTGRRWRALIAGISKSFTDADTCNAAGYISCTAIGVIADASVINGALWIRTTAGSDNIFVYDSTWVKQYTFGATYGGNALALIPGAGDRPLVLYENGEWRYFEQSQDNYVQNLYLVPGGLSIRSFGSVAQLNIALLAVAMILVFFQ